MTGQYSPGDVTKPMIKLPTPGDLIGGILRRWRWMAALGVVGGLVAMGVSFVLPAWYESSAEFAVVPIDDPTQTTNVNAIEGAGAALPLFAYTLQSRRTLDEAAAKVDLAGVYGAKSAEDVRRELGKHFSVNSDRKANVVRLVVEDKDPSRARRIAAAMGEAAMKMNSELWRARAGEHRTKLEARLAEVTLTLSNAEEAMRKFREREHIVDLPEQIKASVTEAAYLEHMRTEKKIGLHFARGYAGAGSPEVRRSELEAGGASVALEGLVKGSGRRGPLLALDELPRLEEEHARLKRDIDIAAASYDLIARQLEQLRAAEARPQGRAELVDPPVEPQHRSRPARGLMAVQGTLVGLLLGLVIAAWPRELIPRSRSLARTLSRAEATPAAVKRI